MPIKTIYTGKVERLEILDEHGKVDTKLMPKLSAKEMKEMYVLMVQGRTFDNKAFALQRQGRLGTYGQILGQEATEIGTGLSLKQNDWMIPSFRNVGCSFVAGMAMRKILEYWGGSEWGNKVEGKNILPMAVPIGTQPLHAVGIAWAMKLRKEKDAVLTHFGDGATSEGDFHEAMNFAGVFQVPCVFICTNNQWAISVPRNRQTHAETYAQKAIAYGMEGIQVDGNDVFAVYKATTEALAKARAGKGPTLIEAFTYRMGHHTTSDDATRYRSEKEHESWKKKDPIMRLEKYLIAEKIMSKSDVEKIAEEATTLVKTEVDAYMSLPDQKPTDFIDYVYKEITPELAEQRRMLEQFVKEEPKQEGH